MSKYALILIRLLWFGALASCSGATDNSSTRSVNQGDGPGRGPTVKIADTDYVNVRVDLEDEARFRGEIDLDNWTTNSPVPVNSINLRGVTGSALNSSGPDTAEIYRLFYKNGERGATKIDSVPVLDALAKVKQDKQSYLFVKIGRLALILKPLAHGKQLEVKADAITAISTALFLKVLEMKGAEEFLAAQGLGSEDFYAIATRLSQAMSSDAGELSSYVSVIGQLVSQGLTSGSLNAADLLTIADTAIATVNAVGGLGTYSGG